MESKFTLTKSSNLINMGWGSRVRLLPGGTKALVMYAHQAFYTVSLQDGKYERAFWELPDGYYVDYDAICIASGGVFVSSCKNDSIYHLDSLTGDMREVIHCADTCQRTPLAFSNGYLAYADSDGLKIYSVSEKQQVQYTKIEIDAASKVMFHPSGNFFVYKNSNTLSAFETRDGNCIWEIHPFEYYTRNDYWEFSSDGQYLIICPYEECVHVYDVSTGLRVANFRKGNDDTVTEAHLDPYNRKLITSSCDGKLRIWDFEKVQRNTGVGSYRDDVLTRELNALLITLDGHKEKGVYSVSPRADFKAAISYTKWDSTFYLWDLEEGQLLDTITFEHPIDDYRILWEANNVDLFVAENTEGFSLDMSNKKPSTPQIRISHVQIQ